MIFHRLTICYISSIIKATKRVLRKPKTASVKQNYLSNNLTKPMYENILIQNGFTPKEAKVYLSILEYGQATMSMIARKTNLERPTIYDIVSRLENKGYASTIKTKGIKHVTVTPPSIIIQRLKNSVFRAEKILPDLMEMAYKSPIKPRIKFYEGTKGLKQVLTEYSQAYDETYVFSDYSTYPKDVLAFIYKEIIPERIRRNSFTKMLVVNTPKHIDVKKNEKKYFQEHRLINFPSGMGLENLEVLLWENKIGFLSFGNNELFGMIIESKSISQMLKNVHCLIWENATKL